jgi:hypothetical protein
MKTKQCHIGLALWCGLSMFTTAANGQYLSDDLQFQIILADDKHPREGTTAQAPLHFSHPLTAESPSPDNKIRLDYILENRSNSSGGNSHTLQVEFEHAFNPAWSIEFGIPYAFINPDTADSVSGFGNAEIGIKHARYDLADQGIIYGGGLEIGLPSGDGNKGIGSHHEFEIEPFFFVGKQQDQWELIGFAAFGIPGNRNGEDEADWEVEWNTSLLHHHTDTFATVLELDGEIPKGGEEEGEDVVNATVGIKFQPTDDPNLSIGIGGRFPLTDDKGFHAQVLFSMFWHY